MGETDKSIDKASTLFAERRKYEAWLAALDQRRATTPEHVLTRVRADYEARLEAVVTEMARNAEALETRVSQLSDRVEALRGEVQAVQDGRAEAELRAHVGELEGAAWEQAAREAEQKLEELTAERAAAEEELAAIRELLTVARTPAQSTAAVERASGGFDELAFLRDVTGGAADAAASPPTAPPAPPAAEATREAIPEATPEQSAPAQPERPVDDTLGLVLPNDAPAIIPTRRPSTETPMSANVASNAPLVLRPENARQDKTLKCTECGSMNYPTEWYCERCGAELSAL